MITYYFAEIPVWSVMRQHFMYRLGFVTKTDFDNAIAWIEKRGWRLAEVTHVPVLKPLTNGELVGWEDFHLEGSLDWMFPKLPTEISRQVRSIYLVNGSALLLFQLAHPGFIQAKVT